MFVGVNWGFGLIYLFYWLCYASPSKTSFSPSNPQLTPATIQIQYSYSLIVCWSYQLYKIFCAEYVIRPCFNYVFFLWIRYTNTTSISTSIFTISLFFHVVIFIFWLLTWKKELYVVGSPAEQRLQHCLQGIISSILIFYWKSISITVLILHMFMMFKKIIKKWLFFILN